MVLLKPFQFDRPTVDAIIFCVACFLGFVFGAVYISQYSYSSLMRLPEYPQMSIVTGVVISALPFLVFYICLRYSAVFMIPPIAFLRAFVFMYCYGGLSLAYGDAGWLVRYLLLFSDYFTVPLLIWYTVKRLRQNRSKKDPYIRICLLSIVVVRCIDSFVISPFAWRLLKI